MKKTIQTIALAVGMALPIAAITSTPAEAYGERWYMVKNPTISYFDQGGRICDLSKGTRLERKSGIKNGRMKARVVGSFWQAGCTGWVPIRDVYNMDTTVDKLVEYANARIMRSRNSVPLFKRSGDVWYSRNVARDHGTFPRSSRICWIPVGTKVHVSKDHFNGSAEIHVVDGPCKGTNGWILSYTLDREKGPK